MEARVQNIDEQEYQALCARAVVEGRTVDELISDAIHGYLVRISNAEKRGSLRALKPEPFPEGNEHLSSEIDAIVYGARQ